MVVRGKKVVVIQDPPKTVTDSTEGWVMNGTHEFFTDYESYIRRLEYLKQKKFIDAVNGKSGLTFFEALESENRSAKAIDDIFPPPLKDPILRKVQFSTISRMDDLVGAVFDEFKKDFFPGESVHVFFEDGENFTGLIREKAKFPMIRQVHQEKPVVQQPFAFTHTPHRGPDGTVQRPSFSRYFVRLPDMSDKEALVDDKHIRRDKKVFTKQNLRQFLKSSLQRESWIGAPWLVKEHLAITHRLPMEIPPHLMQDAKLLANKQMLQMKPPKTRRPRPSEEVARQQQELHRMQQMQGVRMSTPTLYLPLTLIQHTGGGPNSIQQGYHQPLVARIDPRPPPPPVIRYPIEDTDLPPNGRQRPQLNYLTEEQKAYVESGRRVEFDDISMESTGLLLEAWNTLNVQCEVYVLDSFTLDDFKDAMEYRDPLHRCELLDEVHCAVLSQIVDKTGKLQIVGGMADMIAEVDDSTSNGDSTSEYTTPQPDVPARSTRSRLSHVDPTNENGRTPTTDRPHRAAEMLGERSWKTRLAARDFENGGWIVIMIGLLHQLSAKPMWKLRCDKILAELAPIDFEPTLDTARDQYLELNVNLRLSALQMITLLSISTPAIKHFLESCSEDMTDVRKRKTEHQKDRKACIEELQVKDRDRRILWPQNMPDSPTQGSAEPIFVNGEGDDTLETNQAGSSDPDDDAPSAGRSLRRASDRKRKRDEDTARREKEKAEKAEAAKKESKQSREFKKLEKDISELKDKIAEHEAKIQDCDADLREANVQRTKVLGKDRYCNRYYWFERNGQPFGGLPRSSTASYGYANGRIWVQGPDDMEAEGFINLPPDQQKQYRQRFGMTVVERRKHEEGTTSLLNAQEWGFYDDPQRLDQLIGWLEEKGDREKPLRKELCTWRDTIVQYMEAYKTFHNDEAAKKLEQEEEHATRVSTRRAEREENSAAAERCTKWTNTMALDEMGHLHSRPGRKPVPKIRTSGVKAKGVATLVSRSTGKAVTRQGGNYSFK
ncbi:hypothetical protein LTR62_007851 [Meristemomyces frigidus]|uniref:WAC domain-containing protein n=1 Tax=Meristemomyces frigidus TaxID=1508187 RepID=A0AAN7TB90_9PEZI|nr:hypothetical protein LTR62_007851 [Meristemomyces frigidus]